MTNALFVDTGGYFALLNPRDQWHSKARNLLAAHASKDTQLFTTDYVLVETATLLRARGETHLVEPWLSNLLSSKRSNIQWTDRARFEETREFFQRHSDKQWSFTDCTSFCIMQELGI